MGKTLHASAISAIVLIAGPGDFALKVARIVNTYSAALHLTISVIEKKADLEVTAIF